MYRDPNDPDYNNNNNNNYNNNNNNNNNNKYINKYSSTCNKDQPHLSPICGTADTGSGIGTLGDIWRPHNVNNSMILINQPPSCGKAAFDSGKGAIRGGEGGGH